MENAYTAVVTRTKIIILCARSQGSFVCFSILQTVNKTCLESFIKLLDFFNALNAVIVLVHLNWAMKNLQLKREAKLQKGGVMCMFCPLPAEKKVK